MIEKEKNKGIPKIKEIIKIKRNEIGKIISGFKKK